MKILSIRWFPDYYLTGGAYYHCFVFLERQCKIIKNRSQTMPLIALSTSSHDTGGADWTLCCRITPASIQLVHFNSKFWFKLSATCFPQQKNHICFNSISIQNFDSNFPQLVFHKKSHSPVGLKCTAVGSCLKALELANGIFLNT